MIEDSAKRQFQAVIVYRLDRFTRNRYDSAIYKARLKKNGVKVLSAMENLNGSPESIIMESLLEGMAEYYSVELSQKITRGMRENALKGKALGGQRVLGYKVNSDCYFEIDETTAPVVVDIFKLYSSGKTVKEICDILNARGVKTARGGAFNKNSLHTILTNKKYIGIYKTKYGEIVGGIPAIIDKELFEMVALRMEQNKKAPARAKAEINYLLSTKLFCGKCRSAMVGESGTSKTGKKYYYYACVKKKREKACDKSNVKKDWIEDLVIQRTVTDILKDDVIEKIADRLVELQKAEAAESGTMLYLQNSLAEIQVSIKNIMTAIEKGIITESTKTRLTELEDEKRNVEIEIAKESIARRIISREQIIYWISSFKDGDITSEKYRQQLIDTFVHAVFVYDDKIVITYNYSGENNTATISDLDLSSPPQKPVFSERRFFSFLEVRMKLIALDLDGTLLNSEKVISAGNFAALSLAAEQGHVIVPATGRALRAIPEQVMALPFLRYAITINGAKVSDARTGETLLRAELALDTCLRLMDFAGRYDAMYDCYWNDTGWVDRAFLERVRYYNADEEVVTLLRRTRAPVEDLKAFVRANGQPVQKVQLCFRDMAERETARAEITAAFPDVLVTSSFRNNLELNAVDADKGRALLALARHLGIPVEDTVAFGDSSNDLRMLRAAGTSVAMGNAAPEVRAVCDYVTDTNDRDGVAAFLRTHILHGVSL